MLSRYDPAGRLLGTFTVTCPLVSAVEFWVNCALPFDTSWTSTVAPGAGVAVDAAAPSAVWRAWMVNEPPGDRIGGMVACAVRTTGGAKRFGLATLPALKPGFCFITRKAGDVDEEYWEM